MRCLAVKWVVAVSLFGLMVSALAFGDDAAVVVTGEGFVIDDAYMRAITEFYSLGSVSTSYDEYLSAAIKIKVFSLEARQMGLEPMDLDFSRYVASRSEDIPEGIPMDQILDDVALAEAFSAAKLREYPVDDLVIQSYYHSYPNRFRGEDGILELNDVLKYDIRMTIVDAIRKRIVDGVYVELEKKYAVNVK